MKRIIALIISVFAVLSMAACGETTNNNQTADASLEAIMNDIKGQISLSGDMMEISSVDKLLDYYGIDPIDVAEFQVMMNSSGVEQDEIAMIKAVDEEAADLIAEKFNTRLESKKQQMKNYLPDQYAMLEKCSVEQDGVYVYMFLSADAQAMTDIYNSYFS